MDALATRREALAAFAGLAGSAGGLGLGLGLLWPAALRGQPLPRDGETTLHVSVHVPGGAHFGGNAIVLVSDSSGNTTPLSRSRKELTYATAVRPGRYRLRVKVDAADFAPVDHEFTVPADGLYLPAYLGKPEWPSFRWGQSVVPFAPVENIVAVVFPERGPGRDARSRLPSMAKRAGLDPHPNGNEFLTRGNTVAFFRSGTSRMPFGARRPPAADMVARFSGALSSEWGGVRVGMPLDMRPGHLKILDNRYVVRCRRETASSEMLLLARKNGASARLIEGLEDTWLFEFSSRGDYRQHLSAVASFGRDGAAGDVIYAEPSLIFDLQQHACSDPQAVAACTPASQADLPNDPWAPCAKNLTLQSATQAWCFLDQRLGTSLRFGNPNVCIATIDAAGINAAHPDAVGVEYANLCSDCPDMPEDDHGMSVFGIVSAVPGNSLGISGIAPGVHHIAVRTQRQWSAPDSYAQLIQWIGGVASAPGMPALLRAADIVACSHGLADLPTPSVVSDAFSRVSDEGRPDPATGAKLGTVLVYSAGNANTDVCGTQGFAAHPRVVAVGNTMPADGQGLEVKAHDSNFGDAIALCAQGEKAPSLLANPAMRIPGTCAPPRGSTVEGAGEFGGTSAACPMVGATAALMLSINDKLAWRDVGALLRATAHCVDPVNGAWIDHRSYVYGSGRLDVRAAVKAAADLTSVPVAQSREPV